METPSLRERMNALYEKERERLMECARDDGAYLSPVFGEGALPAKLLFIGEAPGASETAEGRPFVGKAGRQLDEMLEKANIRRADVYITNAVKYRPTNGGRNRTPRQDEVRFGLNLLAQEIALSGAKVIATLGNVPLNAVLLMHGLKPAAISCVHGTASALGQGRVLFALYHPASAIYNRALTPVLESDLIALGALCSDLCR